MSAMLSKCRNHLRRSQANCLNLWAGEKVLLALGKELLDFFFSCRTCLE